LSSFLYGISGSWLFRKLHWIYFDCAYMVS